MAINIYDEQYNDQQLNAIFNGGAAGIAKGCTARVEKKKDTDPANHPAYRIIYTDDKGGEINKGYFDNLDAEITSDKARNYFVKEMRHLLNESNADKIGTATTYSEVLNMTMKELYKAMPKNKYNLAVSFGTIEYPRAFLEVNGYWGILNVESDRLPNLPKNAITQRPVPDKEEIDITDDLPFGDVDSETITEDEVDW